MFKIFFVKKQTKTALPEADKKKMSFIEFWEFLSTVFLENTFFLLQVYWGCRWKMFRNMV